jgi:hypothetical protein
MHFFFFFTSYPCIISVLATREEKKIIAHKPITMLKNTNPSIIFILFDPSQPVKLNNMDITDDTESKNLKKDITC